MVPMILETGTERWRDMTWACTPSKGQVGLTCIPGALGEGGYQEVVGGRHSCFWGHLEGPEKRGEVVSTSWPISP